jgi:hypothetical protein
MFAFNSWKPKLAERTTVRQGQEDYDISKNIGNRRIDSDRKEVCKRKDASSSRDVSNIVSTFRSKNVLLQNGRKQ